VKRTAAQTLREIAEDYLHLAQDADGKVDSLRRRRYKWLVKLAAKSSASARSHTKPRLKH
jgi:hypothetical protein